jgi:hypothetical protein
MYEALGRKTLNKTQIWNILEKYCKKKICLRSTPLENVTMLVNRQQDSRRHDGPGNDIHTQPHNHSRHNGGVIGRQIHQN